MKSDTLGLSPSAAPRPNVGEASGDDTRAPEVTAPDIRADVEAVVRASGTSFFWAMRLLPAPKRNAMFAVYAFCREVDDIADEPGEIDDKRRQLNDWRRAIEDLYRGKPTAALPLSQALAEPVRAFSLRKQDFLAVIDGMEMDAGEAVRIANQAELSLYCDRVACAVGRLSTRIFGTDADDGDRLAFSLGQALQLTNILRDLDEDAERERLYLPADLLAAAGIDASAAPGEVLRHPCLGQVCEALAETTRIRFAEARAIIERCDRKKVRPAVVMMEVYGRTFRRLLDRGWQRWAEPVSVPSAEKLWIALRYGFW